MAFSDWIRDQAERGAAARGRGDEAAEAEARNEITAAVATGKVSAQDFDDTIAGMLAGGPLAARRRDRRRR
jgi:hypothetical protein